MYGRYRKEANIAATHRSADVANARSVQKKVGISRHQTGHSLRFWLISVSQIKIQIVIAGISSGPSPDYS